MSNLVDHARRELELINEEPDFVEAYLKIVETFAGMGHSGGSAEVAIIVIHQLLQQQNLSPLTSNPEEWEFHSNEDFGLPEDAWNNGKNGVWQNRRFGEAFSNDGGKTYFLLSENASTSNPKVIHTSRNHEAA